MGYGSNDFNVQSPTSVKRHNTLSVKEGFVTRISLYRLKG
jgi:hypothetical protein